MPSTASTSLRLELQATGEQLNQWGVRLNESIVLLEEAITKVTAIALTGNKTLTAANYATDEARSAALVFTDGGLASAPTVTIPAVNKLYYVHNQGATYAITFTAGGVSASLPAARKGFVICDGTDVAVWDPKADVLAIQTAAEAARDLAEDWANETGATVTGGGGEYSAKEYASGDLTATGGSAKAWAIDASSPDGTSEKSAKTLAGEAATSASTATTQAGIATTKAGEAATSATNAAASYDSFDDRYLGAKATAPTLDNDGDALITGALYFDTVDNQMQVWNGSAWAVFVPDAANYYSKSQTDTLLDAKLALAGGTMTGGLVMADQLLTRPLLKDFGLEVVAKGNSGTATQTLSVEGGNYFTLTATGNHTIAFSDPTASGDACVLYLQITNGGAFTITWPAAVSWDAATAPTLQTSGVDILAFVTTDGGTTWRGFPVWQAA